MKENSIDKKKMNKMQEKYVVFILDTNVLSYVIEIIFIFIVYKATADNVSKEVPLTLPNPMVMNIFLYYYT